MCNICLVFPMGFTVGKRGQRIGSRTVMKRVVIPRTWLFVQTRRPLRVLYTRRRWAFFHRRLPRLRRCSRWGGMFLRESGTDEPVLLSAGGIVTAVNSLVTRPRTPEAVDVTESAEVTESGVSLSPSLSVPPISAPRLRANVPSDCNGLTRVTSPLGRGVLGLCRNEPRNLVATRRPCECRASTGGS